MYIYIYIYIYIHTHTHTTHDILIQIYIYIRPNNSQNKTNKCNNIKTIFLHTICNNSDIFRSVLIILREFLNIVKTCKNIDELLNTLKFVHKISTTCFNTKKNDIGIFMNSARLSE